MYNIKEAAARAGVTVPVLRAWERRYGIVRPARTPSGYRQFDDDTIARIRTMRRLVDAGWPPSAAAAAVVAGEVPIDQPGAEVAPAALDDRSNGTTAPERPAADELGERFVAAARDLDGAEIEAVLDDLFSRGSFERVASDLLFPTLHRLGEAWAAGEVSVAGEHVASAAVFRRLALALAAAGRGVGSRPRVAVGLPPGARHELGALAFAAAARRAGISVTYLGADLPVADWVVAAESADAAVIGVVSPRDRRPALEVASALRARNPDVVIAFGGGAAPAAPGVLRLGESLPEAVEQVRAALGSEG